MTAALHADFVDLAMDNSLVTPGRDDRARRARSTCRQVDVDAYVVAGIADHITPWQNCYRSTQLLGGDDPVRAVHQRPHRRAGQPARQPEGDLPGQHRTTRPTPQAWLAGRGHRAGQLVARLRGLARPSAAARDTAGTRPSWAAAACAPLADAPGTYVFDS